MPHWEISLRKLGKLGMRFRKIRNSRKVNSENLENPFRKFGNLPNIRKVLDKGLKRRRRKKGPHLTLVGKFGKLCQIRKFY